MNAIPVTIESIRSPFNPIAEATVDRTKELARKATASATHLICCRSTPLDRRNRSTREATLPTSSPMSDTPNTASGIPRSARPGRKKGFAMTAFSDEPVRVS